MFELVGIKGKVVQSVLDEIDSYQKALALYRERHFEEALELLAGDSGPSRWLKEQCEYALENPESNFTKISCK